MTQDGSDVLDFTHTGNPHARSSPAVTIHKICPVCNRALADRLTASFKILTGRGRREWQRCPYCCSYFDTTPYDVSAEAANTQQHSYGRRNTGLLVSEHKSRLYHTVLDFVDRFAPKGALLLDFGCSYGGLLKAARLRGYNAQGADIVDDAIDYVRRQGFVCFDASTAEWRDVSEETFDVITVLDCNYYWENQGQELLNLHCRLKPGGLLIMRTVVKSWLLTLGLRISRLLPGLGQKLCWRAVNDHRISVPVSALTTVIKSAGFELRYVSPHGAVQSDRTSVLVKQFLWLGSIVWSVTGFNMAPAVLVVATKSKGAHPCASSKEEAVNRGAHARQRAAVMP